MLEGTMLPHLQSIFIHPLLARQQQPGLALDDGGDVHLGVVRPQRDNNRNNAVNIPQQLGLQE